MLTLFFYLLFYIIDNVIYDVASDGVNVNPINIGPVEKEYESIAEVYFTPVEQKVYNDYGRLVIHLP